MEKPKVILQTIDELVSYTINHKNDDSRWSLGTSEYDKWENEEDGSKWSSEYYGLDRKWSSDEGYNEYVAQREEIESRKPAQNHIIEYYLTASSSSSYRNRYIYISASLFSLIAKTWKLGPTWRGSTSLERKGKVTLQGILKRLGQTDVSKQIEQAKENERLESEKRNRNYARKNVKEWAEKILGEIKNHPEIVWPIDIQSLVEIEQE